MMHDRLLSFLSDIERSIAADDPAPDDARWDSTRTVNYRLGLARVSLGITSTDGTRTARGSVFVQSFKLADNTPCLKVQFTWAGNEGTRILPIYAKPGTNWVSEARRVAAEWLAGPPARVHTLDEEHLSPLQARAAEDNHPALAAAVG